MSVHRGRTVQTDQIRGLLSFDPVQAPRWVWWTAVVVGAVLLLWGWFVLGFLTEPSAVGRMRSALVGIGVGSLVVGAAGVGVGLWMLFRRRT